MKIDLQQFCSTDDGRLVLQKPWSTGDYSFATNGHIAVRVPRRADVDDNSGAPNMQKLGFSEEGEFAPVPVSPAYEIKKIECSACEGTGKEHCDCPGCACECEMCDGDGFDEEKQYAEIAGVRFDLKYIAQLRSLPDCKIRPVKNEPSPFIFSGGVGLLMPVKQ